MIEPETANWTAACTFACPSEGCGTWLEAAYRRQHDSVRCPKCGAEWDVTFRLSIERGGHPTIRSGTR